MEQNEQMYYLRSTANKEIVLSVCVIKDMETQGVYHRGIAVRSLTDQQNKVEGRKRAIARARRANGSKMSSSPVQTERVLRRMSEVGIDDVDFMKFKSTFCCKLTKFEQGIMDATEARIFNGA